MLSVTTTTSVVVMGACCGTITELGGFALLRLYMGSTLPVRHYTCFTWNCLVMPSLVVKYQPQNGGKLNIINNTQIAAGVRHQNSIFLYLLHDNRGRLDTKVSNNHYINGSDVVMSRVHHRVMASCTTYALYSLYSKSIGVQIYHFIFLGWASTHNAK